MNRKPRYQLTLGNHQLRVATVLLMPLAPQVVPLLAADQITAVGIDRKFTYNLESEKSVGLESGRDEVLFYDRADPGNPRLLGGLPIASSVFGRPNNIVISPNPEFALLANALTKEEL